MIARGRDPDVDYVVDKLVQIGVISEDGCSRLADFFRRVEALSDFSSPAPASLPRRGPELVRRPVEIPEAPESPGPGPEEPTAEREGRKRRGKA